MVDLKDKNVVQEIPVTIDEYIKLKTQPIAHEWGINEWGIAIGIVVSILTIIYTISSSYQKLVDKLDSHGQKLDENTEKTDHIQQCLQAAETAIESRLERQQDKIEHLDQGISNLELRVENIEGYLSRKFRFFLGIFRNNSRRDSKK